jgi:Fe-S oxidoreductase
VAEVVLSRAAEIDAGYPTLQRNVGGYALDRILNDLRRCKAGSFDQVDLSGLICGSEGTLGFLVGAELALVPNPSHTGLSILAFADVSSALRALGEILKTDPSAVELLDDTVLAAARAHETYRELAELLPSLDGKPAEAVLYVDWFANDEAALEGMMSRLDEALPGVSIRRCMDAGEQADLWRLRKVGLGLILTGDAAGQAVGGLEDCAVPVEYLAEFQYDFESMLAAHGLRATWYAHASVGLLHVRPRIDLRLAAGRELLEQLAREATPLVRRYGGTVSGEHGDGRIRAAMMHEFYGPELVQAFREIKHIFDPDDRFNPGIITTDPGMMKHLRISNESPGEVATWFRWEPSLVDAATACNGNALCRRTSGGAMCPSYRATLDERHTTRGRGNALRLAITGQFGSEPWADPDTLATLDACLGCKACRYECPASVDVAKLKAEYLAHAMKASGGPSMRTRLKGGVRPVNRIGSALHPVSTWLIQHGPTAWLIKRMMGVAASRTLPGFSRSLIRWHARRGGPSDRPVVLLYPDCFTTWSESSVGRDAVRLLEAFGYRVEIPNVGCCGRTKISAGLLDDAARVIGRSAIALAAAIEQHQAIAVVAVEPTCVTAMQQEWMELRTSMPRTRMEGISAMVDTIEGFIASRWEAHPTQPMFEQQADCLPIHQHCHQKHRGELTESFLKRCGWPRATLLDTGCCGMAGAFGYERRHDALSRRIAAQSLAMLRDHADPVAAGGTSCRHQAADVLQLRTTHPVSLAASALAGYPDS